VHPANRRGGLFLLPAAVFAVHQLRYWLAYGDQANAQLIAQGHSYLHSLVPWAILALAVGAGMFVRRLAHAARTGEGRSAPRLHAGVVWCATSVGLVAIYATQEALEALLATGHPTGIGGVFGHGGWWAFPAAAVVAALVTALLLLGRVLIRAVAAAPRRRRFVSLSVPAPRPFAAAVVRPLARAAAGRAPPVALPSR
jgi:hypothetical protein